MGFNANKTYGMVWGPSLYNKLIYLGLRNLRDPGCDKKIKFTTYKRFTKWISKIIPHVSL